jgi:hypothetical protein
MVGFCLLGCKNEKALSVAENGLLRICVPNTNQVLWQYTVLKTGKTFSFQAPDKFLEFSLKPYHSITLQAVKGNYYNDFPINKDYFYQTIWFEAGAVAGDENLWPLTSAVLF